MNILLANDDGIDARGIHELADALKGLGDLYISAPDSQRSASGHGITVSQPITVTETTFPGATGAFRMSGTPADCVKLGVKLLQKEGIKIDMVFSGINHGGNLGTDTLYSGTVSAALEGTICGIQSVAVSVNSHEVKTFEYAKILARRTCENVAGKTFHGYRFEHQCAEPSTGGSKGDQIRQTWQQRVQGILFADRRRQRLRQIPLYGRSCYL